MPSEELGEETTDAKVFVGLILSGVKRYFHPAFMAQRMAMNLKCRKKDKRQSIVLNYKIKM